VGLLKQIWILFRFGLSKSESVSETTLLQNDLILISRI